MIIGEQGSGKSSLLNHILYKLNDDENTLLIKLSALNLENFNQQNFLKHVVEILREESKQYRSKSGKLLDGFLRTMTDKSIQDELEERRAKEYSDISKLQTRFITMVEHLKKNQIKICIIVDDIDKIDSNLVWLTFRNIRDQIWKLKISIILTALSNQVSEITKSQLDHFFSHWIKISPFNFKSTRELVQRRLDYAHSDIKVTDDAVEETLRRTGGN
ncbi:MAG: ATP-binding protein, partial [Patescibacteria group bacterium]